ncbi:MAG: hypothetical protein LRS49_04790, partial [Desulfurococcales archaeon]|nr:hypothetical protein [Desulfurococcales archaeon]
RGITPPALRVRLRCRAGSLAPTPKQARRRRSQPLTTVHTWNPRVSVFLRPKCFLDPFYIVDGRA